MRKIKIKTKLSQIVLVAIVGLIGVFSVNAQAKPKDIKVPIKDIKVTVINDSDIDITIKEADKKDFFNSKKQKLIGIVKPGERISSIKTKTGRMVIVFWNSGRDQMGIKPENVGLTSATLQFVCPKDNSCRVRYISGD